MNTLFSFSSSFWEVAMDIIHWLMWKMVVFLFFFFQNLSLKFSFPKSKNRNSRGKCFLLVSLIWTNTHLLFNHQIINKQWRIKGGAQRLSIRLREEIIKMGGKVKLDDQVTHIKNKGGRVLVKTKKGKKRVAKYCVCTVPLHLQSSIQFDPPLPIERRQLSMRSPMGSIFKCFFFYKEAFWRKKGLCANTFSLVPPITLVFDATNETHEYPALVCFIAGKNARK